MTSFLTGALGDYLGDAVAAAVGIEHTAAEFSERAEAAFKRADADGSGTLDFGETVAACRAVPGLRRLSETRAREIFARFDEDDSGSLDVHEFRKLAALLRSVHALDQMPGVIYCGGKLMNPSQNPAVARAARLTELYSRPYEPKSALAKAVARRTVLRRVVYGGVDLANLEALTDDEEAESRESRDDDKSRLMSSDGKTGSSSSRRSRRSSRRSSRRTSRSRKETRELSWSVGALEAAYAALLVVRLICAVYGTAYVHPDEYHQTVEIGASDVLGVAASPRAWEFDDGAPARSVAGHVLAAGAAFRVWRFIESFDRNVAHVARATLAGAAGGCERAALAKGLAAGLREAASRVGGGGADGADERSAFFVSPAVIFLAPRVFAFCASLLVDLAAARAARATYWAQAPALASSARSTRDRRDASFSKKSFSGAARAGLHARLLAASAWPAATLLVRPLTNAVECVLVSSLLCLACANASDVCDDDCEVESYSSRVNSAGDAKKTEKTEDGARESSRRVFTTSLAAPRAALVAGAVTAVGTWTRFTFPLFAAPLGVLLVARAARASHSGSARFSAARGALVAAAAGAAGFATVASCLVVADTAYFKGVDVVDAAFFGEASFFFGGDADARAKRLADLLHFVRGFTNDFIATGVAWFRDPGLPPLDAFSQAWRETSAFVAATRGAVARLARRIGTTPWVVTPYNALAYNLDTKNLATHGIHPRCTHLLINFPMLFGPLAWVAYRASFEAARSFATRSFSLGTKKRAASAGGSPNAGGSPERAKRTPTTGAVTSANATRAALLALITVPLVCLSLAPHQEPRFLLPLLPAAAAAAAADGAAAQIASSPVALATWSAANLLGAAFFGFAHQGGVVPAVTQLSTVLAEDDESSDHALVYFWRTYTPPESLLAFPDASSFRSETTARDDAARASFDFRSTKNGSPSDTRTTRRRASSISPSHIVDLRGASMDSVLAAFAANEDWSHFYVVAPATAAEALRARLAVTSPGAAVAETWRRRGHFSGEELAGYRDAFTRGGVRGLWDAMALGVYAVER